MKPNKFPSGWDKKRVLKVLEFYESQNDDKAVAEDEQAFRSGETTMTIPRELVPAVRELIAKYRPPQT